MWKCKVCGKSEFYEYGYGDFQHPITVDEYEERGGYECDPDDLHPNLYSCANCRESGDCLEEIADWVEEE